MKRTWRFCVNICGGTGPEKRLNLKSKNVKVVMPRTAVGNGPDNSLLLKKKLIEVRDFGYLG